jgi:hypothetical protein
MNKIVSTYGLFEYLVTFFKCKVGDYCFNEDLNSIEKVTEPKEGWLVLFTNDPNISCTQKTLEEMKQYLDPEYVKSLLSHEYTKLYLTPNLCKNNGSWSNDEEEIQHLGKPIQEVSRVGGEGQGENYHVVWWVAGFYFKSQGNYYSHQGVENMSDLFLVVPTQKCYTEYHPPK